MFLFGTFFDMSVRVNSRNSNSIWYFQFLRLELCWLRYLFGNMTDFSSFAYIVLVKKRKKKSKQWYEDERDISVIISSMWVYCSNSDMIVTVIAPGNVMIRNKKVDITMVLLTELFLLRVFSRLIVLFVLQLNAKISRMLMTKRRSAGKYE